MKRILTLVIFFVTQSLFSQSVKLISVKPTEIKACDKFNPTDDGVRTLLVTLELTGKSKRNVVKLELEIITDGTQSKPKLVNPVITLNAMAFPGKPFLRNNKTKQIDYPVNIKLTPVACLLKDENFTLKEKSHAAKGPGLTFVVKHITTIPDTAIIRIREDSTVIKSLSTENDDGMRMALVTLMLAGPRPNNDVAVKFVMPPYSHSPSKPELVQQVTNIIPKSAFSEDGCPVATSVPVVLKLNEISVPEKDEYIPVLFNNEITSAHIVIIRSAVQKTPVKTEENTSNKKISFSYACKNGHNFSIYAKTDSLGGHINVMEQDKTTTYEYTFSEYFYSTDFSRWLLNIFKPGIGKNACDDCASCASEMAEKVFIELQVRKQALIKSTDSNPAKTDGEKKDDTKKTDSTKKDSTATPAVNQAKNDTIVYKSNISYNDSLLFSLTVKKIKNLTEIRLCPITHKGNCDSTTVAGLTNESFTRIVTQMLQKKRGEETVDENKISPPLNEEFDKFQKSVNDQNSKDTPQVLKDVLAAVKGLNPDEKTESKVGFLSLAKDSLAVLYDSNGNKIKMVKIDSARFSIETGRLVRKQLRIYTSEGIFTNKNVPISISTIDSRQKDMLWNTDPDKNTFIYFGKAITGESNGYVPDDIDTVLLTRANPRKELSAASNLNSLVNFSLYTDLAGLLGRKANGLINTDVSGKFITNTRNIIRNWDLTIFSFIEANVQLSKFDSKFKSIDSSSIRVGQAGQLDTVDRMQLMQIAWLRGAVKFNLASFRLFTHQYFLLNAGTRFNVVNADSLYHKETDVLFFDYFAEVMYSINRLKNFGMELSLKWQRQYLSDKEKFSNIGRQSIFIPQVAFFFYPTSNINNTVYLRFNYFANRDKTANNFYQLQFGWKTGLKLKK